jgi:hypothetical protein
MKNSNFLDDQIVYGDSQSHLHQYLLGGIVDDGEEEEAFGKDFYSVSNNLFSSVEFHANQVSEYLLWLDFLILVCLEKGSES